MRTPIIQLACLGRDHRPEGQHPGLILQRYLTKPATGDHADPTEKRALLAAAIQAARCEPLHRLYKLAFERWSRELSGGGSHRVEDVRTDGRLIVGLGSENVLETGIRLHHTYGLPLIPGSALKGLASHFCAQVWGQPDENHRFRKEKDYHDLLFGSTTEGEASGGVILFHDAWIIPESVKNGCLLLDVLTPHHPEWQTDKKAPTDFDSPIPIAFLSVHGSFRVAISWAGPADHAEAKRWTDLAFTLLKEALREWGVGSKTSSGYGRLAPVDALTLKAGNCPSAAIAKAPAQRKPKYQRGDRLTVTRITDPKGKVKFQADDDFVGHFANEAPPSVEVGQTSQVWVANVSPQGYTLTGVQPKASKKGKK